MTTLWICPRFPVPTNDGARMATMALLTQLVTEGQAKFGEAYQIDIVCFYDEMPADQDIETLRALSRCRDLLLLKKDSMRLGGSKLLRRIGFRLRHVKTPLTVAPFANRETHKKFRTWKRERRWDCTVLDGLHVRELIEPSDASLGRLIYRAHNVESQLWVQATALTKNPFRRFILKRETKLFLEFERATCAEAFATVPVSANDATRFENEYLAKRVNPVAIGFSCPPAPVLPALLPAQAQSDAPSERCELNLLFVGRLDWLPNREGLAWFLEQVLPGVTARRKTLLTIVGSGDRITRRKPS